jgi:histidinol dehydrogenase
MRIIEGYEAARKALTRVAATGDDEREAAVRDIVDNVRRRGDAAVYEFTERFDGVRLSKLEVSRDDIEKAYRNTDKELLSALETARDRIAAFHEEQKAILLRGSKNKRLGWVVRPLRSVGVMVPGVQAPLPSSVLMTAVPTKVAGVQEVAVVTAPRKDGTIAPVILAACRLAEADRVFSIGGAQAVAALAYGTESVPRVDKICGPGNIYGQLAKKMVYGVVGIDGMYGPSEVVIIADETANPAYAAADLLGQAEHASGATAIMITTSKDTAEAVQLEINAQLEELERKEATEAALEQKGFIAVVDSIEEAIELGNLYAPEHLCIVTRNAEVYAEKVTNAGCLFVGENAIEVLVDYVAGPSHVLPTDGTARFSSTLNVTDFVKIMTVAGTDENDIKELGKAASIIARAEGLDAHARAIEKRLEKGS